MLLCTPGAARRAAAPAISACQRACRSTHTQAPSSPSAVTPADAPPSARPAGGFAARYFAQRDARFLRTAVKPDQYAHIRHPEVTFAGRSNVGKSSLINAVLRSQALARTSRKPGRTATLNFFTLSSKLCPGSVSVVDMPGYGFRSRGEWGHFVMEYLASRRELQRVFMLVEAKVGELKATDKSFLGLVEKYGVSTQIVLTKTDKLKRADLDAIAAAAMREAAAVAPSAVLPRAICCSSRTGAGIDTLQAEILRVCRVRSAPPPPPGKDI
ncbi:hypothetical protein LPJ61_001845 [Coemansia biformis]|uniref:GTP-binding protein 8 n=1 Tax=Coemansia biformis TaxID=1286918 RepID=A0A9W7YG41_9FUNG|nr:hypothetical protein LPJ61_001845 [Coemansia biformis]